MSIPTDVRLSLHKQYIMQFTSFILTALVAVVAIVAPLIS
jgi:hypothetical protein